VTLHRVSKVENDRRYTSLDFTRDGMYKEPRVKKDDKRMRQKERRQIIKRMTEKEVKNIFNFIFAYRASRSEPTISPFYRQGALLGKMKTLCKCTRIFAYNGKRRLGK